jgi:formyltetrahydrofolate deformylase
MARSPLPGTGYDTGRVVMSKRHVLRIVCADRVGLVHDVTGVLAGRELNIVSNDEFVEMDTGRFFMRTETLGDMDAGGLEAALRDMLPHGSLVQLTEMRKKQIVVLVTKEAHCLGDLLIGCAFGQHSADVRAVIGSRDVLQELSGRFDVPFHHVDHRNKSREEHECELKKVVEEYEPEYLVLAKYMRILTGFFVEEFAHRIINIHHSFLPAFAGASPYRQAYERGVKIIGATAHFVTADLDEGPIIAQDVVPVTHNQSPQELTQLGRNVEKAVLARALDLVFDERVFVSGNKTIIFP